MSIDSSGTSVSQPLMSDIRSFWGFLGEFPSVGDENHRLRREIPRVSPRTTIRSWDPGWSWGPRLELDKKTELNGLLDLDFS